MTYWINESKDIVKINFDIGKGYRELISLYPEQMIELPAILDKYVPMEAPQLKQVTSKTEIRTNVVVFPVEQPVKKKPGRKPKDNNGIQ